MTDLQSLLELERLLKKADGPDWEIDASLFALNEGHEYLGRYETMHQFQGALGKYCHTPPEYTASLDAAISLLERVLPNWRIDQIGQSESPILRKRGKWYALLVHPEIQGEPTAARRDHAEKPSLALLTAMIKALIQEKENKS